MSDYNKQIDEIQNKLTEISVAQYKKVNYIPSKTSAKELKGPKDNLMAINGLDCQVNRMIRKKEYKKRMKPSDKEEEKEEGIIYEVQETILLNKDNFNIIENEKDYIPWKKLESEEREELLKKYLETISISDEIKKKLLEMHSNGDLMNKKTIEYDKINQQIINIPLLKKIEGELVIKEKKKVKKNNISKLIKTT